MYDHENQGEYSHEWEQEVIIRFQYFLQLIDKCSNPCRVRNLDMKYDTYCIPVRLIMISK
jgi:hypothetical protein